MGVPGGPASGSGVSHGDLVNNGVSGSYYGSSVGDTGHHGDHPDLTGGSRYWLAFFTILLNWI